MEDVTVRGPEYFIDVVKASTMHKLNRLDVIARDDTTKANAIRQILHLA
jgi:hypothetical protein